MGLKIWNLYSAILAECFWKASMMNEISFQHRLKVANHVALQFMKWICDEGMTNWFPIFAYLVFGPGRVSLERLSRPIKAMVYRGPGAKLGVQARTRRTGDRLGFRLSNNSICTWLERQSWDPAFAYKRLGGRSRSRRHFSTHLTPERSTTQSPLSRLDPIYATIVTPSPPSPHQYKVRQAGCRLFTFWGGWTWVNSRVPLLSSDRRRVRQVPNTLPRSKALRHGHCRG
jgi:hypothetical protein